MLNSSLRVVLAVALVGTVSSSALAGEPRTLRVQIYNSSTVAKSKCFVLGMKADAPYRRTLTTFTHTMRNDKAVYTYKVPPQYVRVDVMCKANGPAATNENVTFPLDQHWIKASCPSSQPDAKCTVNEYGGDPER